MALPTKVNVSRPIAEGYGALIEYGDTDAESLYLRLAVGPGRNMSFQTVEPEDKAPNVAQNPEDMRAETGETFSRADFSGGEGLRRGHRRGGTELDTSRFYDSSGVDSAPTGTGEPTPLTLLRSTSELRAGFGGDGKPNLTRIQGSLFGVISSATRVDSTANPTVTSPTWAVENPHAGETSTEVVSSIAQLNDLLYASVSSNGIHQRSSGGTWSHWSDLVATRLWGLKGRVLAASPASGGLYEAASGAASTLIIGVAGTETVRDVADAGSILLVAIDPGDIVHLAEEDGTLVEVGRTPLPGVERPSAIAAVGGIALIATYEIIGSGSHRARLYRAAVVGNSLRNMQLLHDWNDGIASIIWSMTATRDAIWIPVMTTATTGNVWRYDLATGGLFKGVEVATVDSANGIRSVAEIGGRLFVQRESDGDLYREDLTYEDSGYLISPLADFYNAAKKTWIGARLQTGDMPTGTQVDLYYTTDPAAIEDAAHASWTLVITATPGAPGASAETALLDVESRWAALKVVLTANGANTETPEVLAFSIRGVQLPTEDDYAIPVNISDRAERPGHKALTVPGMGIAVYDKLQELKGKAVTVTLLRPKDEVVKGQIRMISTPVEEVGDRGGPTVYAQMIVRGQRQ